MKLVLPSAVHNSLPHGDRALPFVNVVNTALVRLLESNGEPDDTLTLGNALNLATFRLRAIGDSEPAVALIENAGSVVMECDFKRGGRSLASFTREERQLVMDAVDVYDAVMRASSPLQMEKAKQELVRVLRNQFKKVRRA